MKTKLTRQKHWRIPAVLLAVLLLLSALPVSAGAESAPASATTFTFSDSGIAVSGAESGYKIEGTALTINAAGVYTITGSCSEGSVKVKKGTTGVTLVLQNLTLSSSTTAPISCNKGTDTTLYVAGAVTLTDWEDASTEDTNEDFEGACIKVKSESAKLLITGTGTLTLNAASCKNGIKGAATAAITIGGSVKLNVTAANHGIASDGSVTITGGTLNIAAENEGIKSEPDEDDAESAGTITITGGTITVTKADDAIHATNTVLITGGTLNLTCADDAIHSEYDVILGTQGGTAGPGITVKSCYEGFEGARVFLNSGTGSVTASDDGINAATDQAVSEIAIYVNGGTWSVNAAGDGLDAGGDSRNNSGGYIYLNGGTVEVFGAANNGNSALDFDTACEANGGTLLAVGYSGMAQVPTKGTYVAFVQNVGITSGKSIAVKDSSGTTLYSTTARKNANHVVFVSSGITAGQQYTLTVGGSASVTATAASGNGMSGGMMGPGGNNGGGMNPGSGMGGRPGNTGTPQQPGGQNNQNGDPFQRPGRDGQNGPGMDPAADQPFPGEEQELPQELEEETEEPAETPFTDVKPDAWYAPAVSYVYENNIMNGVSADNFSPLTNLTRGMMAQILYNLEGRPAVDGVTEFSDVGGTAWYVKAVDWAKESGIVGGYGNGQFGPNDPITRAQAATILANYAEYKGESTAAGSAQGFNDASSIPGWAQSAMGWCADTGILQGSGGNVNPNSTATRAEVAAIMQRYLTK